MSQVEGWDNATLVLIANERTEILGLENICSGSAGSSEKCNSFCDPISGRHNTSTNVTDLVRELGKRGDKQWNPCM